PGGPPTRRRSRRRPGRRRWRRDRAATPTRRGSRDGWSRARRRCGRTRRASEGRCSRVAAPRGRRDARGRARARRGREAPPRVEMLRGPRPGMTAASLVSAAVIFGACAFFTRAIRGRVLAALVGGAGFAAGNVAWDIVAHHFGWWRYLGPKDRPFG